MRAQFERQRIVREFFPKSYPNDLMHFFSFLYKTNRALHGSPCVWNSGSESGVLMAWYVIGAEVGSSIAHYARAHRT
ncbi:hypothetical protein AB4Y44_12385 [Paraburkholderia sp. BR10937]|uniref:hypothetical protein n=1 Tax=Paraburkholderia sp. BR10937 TaxID=3236994 RepID=UPI0034D1AFBF